MWDIDRNHVLQLSNRDDVREYLRMLLAHIKGHSVLHKA